jgi:REP element-mobilizing transposase RayT
MLAQECWLAIPKHHPHADLDEFVIMPNHVHGVIVIDDDPHANFIRRGVQLNAPTNEIQPRDPNNPFSVMSPHKRSLGVIVRTY